jgi:hypothetical protein
MERKAKRSTMPVVNAALKKALDQLVLAQNAAAISGHHTIATAIGSAVSALRQVSMETSRGSALMH